MTTQREETNILKDIVERLRYAEDLPEEDDAAFRWYAYITEEAANKIESLRLQLAASQARELQLRGQIFLMIDSWWPFVHGSFPSDTTRDMFRKASDSIQPPYDTTALNELIEKVEKITIERCASAKSGIPMGASETIVARWYEQVISALPTIKPEELL